MPTDRDDVYHADLDTQLTVFIDEHREGMAATLDGITDEEARTRLVPSKTTLLGLVKHATFIEKVWFGEGVTGQNRAELGIPPSPDESFDLDDSDTVASVLDAYRAAIDQARENTQGMSSCAVLTGNRRGPLSLRWVQLHFLRELAQHCGHADIIREQIIAARDSGGK